ncbi:hypothetical protein [Nocardia abscessus]|uniref:hypothetical protein n=1 Tax=Nocardia abscessus TaxID=120957 RepID=UPI0002F191BE|nr:hypothetical protein [Nocardia abscessus]MCC3326383.1 hypothetical protein [Nocardia abscessus]
MTDKLDTDEPHEVIATVYKWGTSMTTAGGQTKQVIDNFVAPRRPESEIDRRLVAHTQWMKTTFERAVRANGRRVDATTRFTRETTYAHDDADRGGAAAVRRSTESI